MAESFACPLEDVLAYAEMIGMDLNEDIDLLWLCNEALQVTPRWDPTRRVTPR